MLKVQELFNGRFSPSRIVTLQYVSLVGARYPHSNVRLILSKLDDVIPADSIKKLMARFMGEDGEADAGTVHERMFRTILRDFIGYELRDRII